MRIVKAKATPYDPLFDDYFKQRARSKVRNCVEKPDPIELGRSYEGLSRVKRKFQARFFGSGGW